jgi:hypothetical protein
MGKKKAAPYEKGLRPIIFLTKLMSEGGLSDAVTVHQSCVDTKTLNTLFQNTFYSFHNVILSIFLCFTAQNYGFPLIRQTLKRRFLRLWGNILTYVNVRAKYIAPSRPQIKNSDTPTTLMMAPMTSL